MNDKAKYLLVAAALLALLVIPKVAFSANGLYDSFNYSNTALAQTALDEHGLEFYPYENYGNTINRHANGWSVRWVVTSSIASLSLVTGLSPRDLQALPICAVGILVMAFLVAMKLTGDWRLAALYTVMVTFDPTVNSLTNGTYIQGWGFIFYYLLIYATFVIAERGHYKALTGDASQRGGLALWGSVAACAMAMMYFSYYSTLVYGAILLGVVAAGLIFAKPGSRLDRKRVALFVAAAAALSAALFIVEPSVRFAVSNFGGVLGTGADYAISAVAVGGMRFYVGLFSYLLMGVPILLLAWKWLKAAKSSRSLPAMSTSDLVVAALLVTGVVNVVMYTGLGLVDLKYAIMFFSLAALYALKRLWPGMSAIPKIGIGSLPVRQVLAIALALLFVLKFGAYIAPIMSDDRADGMPNMSWAAEQCLTPGADTIADLRLSGEVMLLHAESGHSEFNSFIFSANYLDKLENGNLTEFETVNGDISFIMMTEGNLDGTFNIGNWETWTPGGDPVDIVGQRENIQMIYSSPGLCIWKVTV